MEAALLDNALRTAGATRLLTSMEIEQRQADEAATGRKLRVSIADGLALVSAPAIGLVPHIARAATSIAGTWRDESIVRKAEDYAVALVHGRGDPVEAAGIAHQVHELSLEWTGSAFWALASLNAALTAVAFWR